MFLKTSAPTSPSFRGKCYIGYKNLVKINHPKLKIGFINSGGRGSSGKRTIFSKGSWHCKRVFRKVIKTPINAFSLGIILKIEPSNQQNRAIALVKTALGGWFYSPATQSMKPMLYFKTVPENTNLTTYVKPQKHWIWKLYQLPPHSKVSWLSNKLNVKASIALAAGSTCLLISSELWGCWSLGILPSKTPRLFSDQTWAFVGGLGPVLKRFISFKKSTKYIMRGGCPQVRGTVKNPNDHPHGGRTRAIKYARTPWGKTAKKSRKPQKNINLKPLNKRQKSLKHYNNLETPTLKNIDFENLETATLNETIKE